MVFLKYLVLSLLLWGCSYSKEEIVKRYYYEGSKSLDSYSYILKDEKRDYIRSITNGSYEGFGIKLIKYKDRVYILDINKNSTAYKRGIKEADELISINDTKTHLLSLKQIYDLMKKSSKVKLLLKHKSTYYSVELKKESIKSEYISDKMIDNNTILIKITSFTKGLTNNIEAKIKKYNIQNIIFDLRSNRGGSMDEAISLADLFISNGVIIYQKDKNGIKKYNSSKKSYNKNIIIFIDRYTASASEIFAGSMQEHKKAILVGEKSFGKATIQRVFHLDKDKDLKLTIAHYLLPSKKDINGIGLIPDIKALEGEYLPKAKEILKGRN